MGEDFVAVHREDLPVVVDLVDRLFLLAFMVAVVHHHPTHHNLVDRTHRRVRIHQVPEDQYLPIPVDHTHHNMVVGHRNIKVQEAIESKFSTFFYTPIFIHDEFGMKSTEVPAGIPVLQ